MASRAWKSNWRDEALQLYENGTTDREIQLATGASYKMIRRWRNENRLDSNEYKGDWPPAFPVEPWETKVWNIRNREGETYRVIAERLGMDYRTIKEWLINLGLPQDRYCWDTRRALEMYYQGRQTEKSEGKSVWEPNQYSIGARRSVLRPIDQLHPVAGADFADARGPHRWLVVGLLIFICFWQLADVNDISL